MQGDYTLIDRIPVIKRRYGYRASGATTETWDACLFAVRDLERSKDVRATLSGRYGWLWSRSSAWK